MIIGLSGKKGSGKSAVAAYLHLRLEGSARIPLAFRAKSIGQECFGATSKQMWGTNEEKDTVTACGLTGRELLQVLIADMLKIWPKFLTHTLEAEVVAIWAERGCAFPIIVEDVRRPDEIECIKRMGGIVIRLSRAPHRDAHESETALDTFADYDAVIENDQMTLAETCAAVMEVCRDKGVV